MTVLIISIIAAWIIFSALLVTVLCMNASRLSRLDEPFNLGGRWTQEELDAAEAFAKEMAKLWDEQHE